jgi:hypothetical protein
MYLYINREIGHEILKRGGVREGQEFEKFRQTWKEEDDETQ